VQFIQLHVASPMPELPPSDGTGKHGLMVMILAARMATGGV